MISTLNHEGIQLFYLGEFKQAQRCFHHGLLRTKGHSIQYEAFLDSSTCTLTKINSTSSTKSFDSDDMDFDEGMNHYRTPLQIPACEGVDSDLIQAHLLFNIGIVYSRTKQVPEAEAHFFKVISILDRRDSILELQGGTSLQRSTLVLRLAVLHNLALAQYRANEHVEAVRIYTKVLATSKTIAGAEGLFNLDIASAFNCIGVSLSYMALSQSPSQRERCLEEATHLLTQALNIRTTVVGPIQTLETAAIINNIGRVYFLRGCIEKAQSNYELAYNIRTSFLEENHIDVAVVLYNIGQVHGRLGNIPKALNLYHRCLNSLCIKFGSAHPRVTRILLEIADIYMEQDVLNSARDYYIQALSSAKEGYDENHPEVASILSKLSDVSLREGNFSASVSLYTDVLTIQMMHFRAGHPALIDTMDRLAMAHEMQGNLKLAIETHEKVLIAHYANSDQDDFCDHVINTLTTIGILQSRSRNYPVAIETYKEILKLEKTKPRTAHDENHVEISSVLNIIGLLYFKMKMFDLAIQNFEESLQLYRNSTLISDSSSSSPTQPTSNGVSIVLYNIASSYKEKYNFDSALKYYKEALHVQRAVKNDCDLNNESDVCSTLIQIGKLYQELGKIDEALAYFQQALEHVQRSDCSSTANTDKIKILTCIGNLHFVNGDYALARIAFDQASAFICCHMELDDDDYDTEDEESDALYKKNLEILFMQLECSKMKNHCAAAA